MHEHDLDLIAAMADGSLADETEARALVQTCEECRFEFQGQQQAIAILSSAPPAHMTDLERAALRRDLWTELRATPGSASTAPWWHRWTYVAAGLLVILGLVGVISRQMGSNSADSLQTAQSFSAAGGTADEESAGDQPAAPLYEAPTEEGAERAATTMAAVESLPYPFADLAEEARARRNSADIETAAVATVEETRCLESLGLEDQLVVQRLNLDQTHLVVMSTDPESETVTFVALDSCRVANVDR